MKLPADENISRSMVAGLRASGHRVISVAEDTPGVPAEKCRMLEIVLDRHRRDLENSFTVITPTQIRIRKAD